MEEEYPGTDPPSHASVKATKILIFFAFFLRIAVLLAIRFFFAFFITNKFSFSKTNPIGADGCDYLSTVLWRHLVDNCGHNADRDCCFAIDIPSGVVATPGKSYKRKIDNIRAACEEIADRWDRV